MIDIVCSAIPKDFRVAKQAEIEGLKTRIFNAIIASEKDKLTTIQDEFDLLEIEIGKRNAKHPV